LHTIYKALSPEEVDRIITYCRDHTVHNGGLFEVYPGPDNSITVIVNSEDEPLDKFRPLGAFYCNHLGPGIISLEEEEPEHEGMPSTKHHIKAIKQIIDDLEHATELDGLE